MIMRTCTWAGVTATIYYLDEGEKLPRHQHSVEHTTMTIAGKATVNIFEVPPRSLIMTQKEGAATLPASVDHEITADEDGTIVLNIIGGSYRVATDAGLEGVRGGVMLDDGTVVPHGA